MPEGEPEGEPPQQQPGYPEPRPLRALLLVLVAGFCFASVSAAIKHIGAETGVAAPICARGLVGTVLCLVLLRWRRQPLRPNAWGMLLLRCGSGVAAMGCYYWSLTPGMGNTDLPTAAMLLKTAPLWVALLSPLVVRERPGSRIWVALALGLVGAGLRFGFSVEGEGPGVLFALLSGFLAGLAYLSLRALARSDGPLTVVTVFSIFQLLAPLPFMGDAALGSWSGQSWILLLIIGLLATGGQFALTFAYRAGSAAAVTVAGLSEILMALGYSVLVFEEVPTVVAFVGASMALGAGLLATTRKKKPRAA